RSSRYMSEGNVGNPDAIDTLSLTLEWGITDNLSFHIGGVGIYDETDVCGNRRNIEEWDWLAGLTYTTPKYDVIGKIEISFDYIYYNYPRNKADELTGKTLHNHTIDTKEYEIDVTAVDLFLSPGIAFVHDFENDVIKANVNVTFEQKLEKISEKLAFECPVELWFGNHQYSGADHTTIYSLCVQPTLNYEITENVSVGTYVLMGWALDSDVRRDWKDDENNNAFNVCWGLNLTLSF
ncbi:MAG: hypothetical protein K5787_12210, partial [Lentisphaeria bacterium]|nr:hypothetical protein [Lentisphaeria bacterium]